MKAGVPAVARDRLDEWLVVRGLAASRTDAQAVIMAGLVSIDGRVVDKPGHRVTAQMNVAVRREGERFASRGGVKLAAALEAFKIDARGKVAADLGASTGGFTDCLLRAGAARVYAVDVGRGLLDWRLRNDPRVTCLEGVNVRHIGPEQIGEPCDIVTVDLAFISLRLVWPQIAGLLRDGGRVIALIKPQFEAGREKIRRGGVVRDPAVHRDVLRAVVDAARAATLVPLAVVPSPIVGPAGNVEFLVHLARRSGPDGGLADAALDDAVARAHTETPRRRRGAG